MVFGLTEDTDGNVWASCGGRQRKLVRIRDFRVRDVLPASRVPAGSALAPDPHGGIWIATTNGGIALLRNGAIETTVSLDPRSSPLNRHIVASPDGSVLVGSVVFILVNMVVDFSYAFFNPQIRVSGLGSKEK